MGFLFGGNKDKGNNKNNAKSKRPKEQLTEKDKASLQVQRQRDRLKKYEKKMQEKIDRETEICRKLLREKKKKKLDYV